MQYILSREELDELVPKSALVLRTEALEKCRVMILEASGFTCIHKPSSRRGEPARVHHDGYCDDCPIAGMRGDIGQVVCLLPKSWSK